MGKNNVPVVIFLLFAVCLAGPLAWGQSNSNGFTFDVCSVEKASEPLEEMGAGAVVSNYVRAGIEGARRDEDGEMLLPTLLCTSTGDSKRLVPVPMGANAFAHAVYQAYATHRPLVISPDVIWLLIVQGLALHIQENAEDLRSTFVDHKGQLNLDVKRIEFHPRVVEYWEGIFPEFAGKIQQKTKEDILSLVAPEFSTTGKKERITYQISLMDAMSPYFQYSVTIVCGIPSITVEGSPEDWAMIKARLNQLDRYGLEWWTDQLRPVIDEMEKAASGTVNRAFWEDIFAKQEYNITCGTDHFFTGWMLDFFPYLKAGQDSLGNMAYIQNPVLTTEKRTHEVYKSIKLDLEDLPQGLSNAKVVINNNGDYSIFNFQAGFVGIQQDKTTLALRPNIDWFVMDTNDEPTQKELEIYHNNRGR
ncbi:MAG: DUF4419 domain-containing protein [Bacteroidota bacterium]